MPDHGESMIAPHQPAHKDPPSEEFGLGHEPDRPRGPGPDQRRIHSANMVGDDQQRSFSRNVFHSAEMEIGASEDDEGQEPGKTREEEIAQTRITDRWEAATSLLRAPAPPTCPRSR